MTYRELVLKLARMDVISRYRGSFLGLGWSFFNPLLLLSVYTFVFSFVFKARWGEGTGDSPSEYALVLFAGLLVHAFFAEVLNRAPALILNNTNYVKKVVFPLEVLPIVALLAAVFHMMISILVLVIAFLAFNGFFHWTVFLIPLVVLPLAMLMMGLAWFLTSLGVFVRDVGQTIGILTTVLLFMSPVFYPMSSLSEKLQWVMLLNPLTFVIEQARAVLIFGNPPNWLGLLLYSVISFLCMWGGFVFFQKTRKGFNDVL
ncbi:ABC transporter permease [Rhizobium leguminosarum]